MSTRKEGVSRFYPIPAFVLPDFGLPWHNHPAMAVPFPTLSRAPLMNEEETLEDSTIRDQMENGAVYTRPRWTRMRRTWKVNYKACSIADRDALRTFANSVGGWNNFTFTDNRILSEPEFLNVRFSKLPTIKDGGWATGAKVFDFSFEITEL